MQMMATASAVSSAIPAHLAGSPPDSTATVDPTMSEMEEVGPTATCLDVVNKAKKSPPAKQQ